jgi:hypothetical protein
MKMKSFFHLLAGLPVLALGLLPGAVAAADNKAGAAAPTEMTQSVFVIPATPQEGRNPFFPNSTMGMVVMRPRQTNQTETLSFVLNGITSPPRSTAIINGRTFEIGEEAEVKLASGTRVLVKCEEITTDSATISVNRERRVLRLRAGL